MLNIDTINENFSKVKILIVGDLMLDRYLWGNVRRISPEAPVPIVNVEKTSLALGGAANVAANVAGLGAEPILIGVTGEDAEADILDEILERQNISSKYLTRLPQRHTTTKTRIVAHSQHVVRFDQETVMPVSENESRAILEMIEKILDEISLIIISDYAKGLLTEFVLKRLITQAKRHEKLLLVDPKGKDFSKYRGVNILTPNLREAAEACKLEEDGQDVIDTAGKKLLEDLSLDAILITKGEKGMTLLQRGNETHHLEALARDVYDVTGAGDTVIAAFGTALGAGASYLEAAKISNIAAGLVVEQIGTTAVNLKALKKAVEEQDS